MEKQKEAALQFEPATTDSYYSAGRCGSACVRVSVSAPEKRIRVSAVRHELMRGDIAAAAQRKRGKTKKPVAQRCCGGSPSYAVLPALNKVLCDSRAGMSLLGREQSAGAG